MVVIMMVLMLIVVGRGSGSRRVTAAAEFEARVRQSGRHGRGEGWGRGSGVEGGVDRRRSGGSHAPRCVLLVLRLALEVGRHGSLLSRRGDARGLLLL